MKNPVIAIALDSAEPQLLEKWMSQGYLKNLNQLRQQGIYGQLNNTINYGNTSTTASSTELVWTMFLTGCLPHKTGYWGPVQYKADSYEINHDNVNGGYDFKEYQPFYALGEKYRIAAFDLSGSILSQQVNGMQILGWGGHFPHTPSHSLPANLLPDLIQQYGKNPIFHKDHGYWWDRAFVDRLQQGIKESISTRSAICRDLLKREDWDLFLTSFSETHSAGHYFWHLSQPDHPLYPYKSKEAAGGDPLLKSFQDVDQAIGEILAEAPDSAYVMLFAVHGMESNYTDMSSMMFLPEVLYRYCFPGKVGLAPGRIGVTPPPLIANPVRRTWAGEIWQRKYESNPIKRLLRPWTPSKFLRSGQQPDLISPYELHEQSAPLNWMPAMWYKPLWSQMKAFALPAFASGQIRINLQGREPNGIVAPSEYDAVCNELTQILYRLRDARTGNPIVKEVVRTRQNATEDGPEFSDADLVLIWQEHPTDVVDSPDLGRIGPVTYYRPGGHSDKGFLMAKGPGITPGSSLSAGETIDMGPTILKLMDAPIPRHLDGKPLLDVSASLATVG